MLFAGFNACCLPVTCLNVATGFSLMLFNLLCALKTCCMRMLRKDRQTYIGERQSIKVSSYSSSPQHQRGTRIGGDGSYKPSGAAQTLQDFGAKPK